MTTVDLAALRLQDPALAARLEQALGDIEPDPEVDDPEVDELDDEDDEPPAEVDRSDPNRIVPFTPPDTSGDEQTWDLYWQEVEAARAAAEDRGPTQVIRGVRVRIPTSLPMRFDRDLERLQGSTDVEDVKALLRTLFGGDVLDAWVDAGMHEDEFRTALLWGIAHAKGKPLTIAQAHEAVRSEGESLRAPASRAERRAAPSKSGKPGKQRRR